MMAHALQKRLEAKRALAQLEEPNKAEHRFRFTDPALLWLDEALAKKAKVDVSFEGAEGVQVFEIMAAPPAATEHLGTLAKPTDRFLAQNLAHYGSGVVVIVPKGAQVAAPIKVNVHAKERAIIRNLYVIGEGARVRLQEVIANEDHLNGVSEVVVGASSKCAFERLFKVTQSAKGFWHSAVSLASYAQFEGTSALVSDGTFKDELVLTIEGTDAQAHHKEFVAAKDLGHGEHRVVFSHLAPNSKSLVEVRALADGQSQALFTGLIEIAEAASGTDAYQSARGLLLDKQAKVTLLPELEILNNDVRASHGAAVGPIDEAALFYLRSRGIERRDALAILVSAFVYPVLNTFSENMLDELSTTLNILDLKLWQQELFQQKI